MQMIGETINHHMVFDALMRLNNSDLITYGTYLEFQVTSEWIQFLYRRINLSRLLLITSQSTFTRAIWLEAWTHYLHNIVDSVVAHNVSNDVIINVDQTPSKYVPIESVTIAEKV